MCQSLMHLPYYGNLYSSTNGTPEIDDSPFLRDVGENIEDKLEKVLKVCPIVDVRFNPEIHQLLCTAIQVPRNTEEINW